MAVYLIRIYRVIGFYSIAMRLQIATPNESHKEQIENPAINRVFY